MKALKRQMILGGQQGTKRVLYQHGGAGTHPPVRVPAGSLLAHEVALVQQLPVAAVHVIEAELDSPAKQDGVSGGGFHRLYDVLTFGLRVSALIDPSRQ